MTVLCLPHGKLTLIDDEDLEFVNQWQWRASESVPGHSYTRRMTSFKGKKGMVYLHRELMGVKPGEEVDHKNRNTIDNQKHNLRVCTRRQNQANTSKSRNSQFKYKGIASNISNDGQRITSYRATILEKHLGSFPTQREAALAYDAAAIEAFGEFACTNKSLGLLKST